MLSPGSLPSWHCFTGLRPCPAVDSSFSLTGQFFRIETYPHTQWHSGIAPQGACRVGPGDGVCVWSDMEGSSWYRPTQLDGPASSPPGSPAGLVRRDYPPAFSVLSHFTEPSFPYLTRLLPHCLLVCRLNIFRVSTWWSRCLSIQFLTLTPAYDQWSPEASLPTPLTTQAPHHSSPV